MSETKDAGTGRAATFDALTELFLGGSNTSPVGRIGEGTAPPRHLPPTGTDESAMPRPIVAEDRLGEPPPVFEAIVVGHLPVRAGPWVTQYAGAIAERDERVLGLARLVGGHCFVDLFGLPEGQRRGHERPELADAIQHAGELCSAWIIQVDDLDVPTLMSSTAIDAITLLCGGNDAAVVDAYKTIKSLVGSDREFDDRPRPAIRIAVVGAQAEHAESVSRRLRQASEAFLREPVELAAWIERMEPRAATPIFRGATGIGVSDLLGLLHTGDDETDHTANEYVPEPPLASGSETARPLPPRQSGTPVIPAAESSDTAPGSLVSFLEGLEPLTIPAPDHTGVEFASDGAGRLHTLTRDDPSGRGITRLLAASAWARKHAELVSMALGERHHLDWSLETRLHLFTERPKDVMGMDAGAVRLHLLAPARRGAGWACVELN